MKYLNTKDTLTAALAACLFVIVVGAKWATFDRYGSAMPNWDQWDAEAAHLLIPWFESDKFTEHLFTPHNEHLVVLTKLQNLALTLANGQWDSRLEAAANALLHAALAVAFWLLGRRWVEPRWRGALFATAAVLFGLPLAWQNVLGGFHSQQYWLLGLSFIAIVLLPFARPGSAAWWIGAAAVLLALGSMASGLLAAVVVIAVVGWRWSCQRVRLRETWPTILVCGAALAIGVQTRIEVYYHAHMKVKTAHDFVFSILRSLEWPLRDQDWAGPILWLPWALVTLRAIGGRTKGVFRKQLVSETRPSIAPPDERDVLTIAALGGWVLIQIVATAYARGAGADYPPSRYMDTLSFGAMVNALALAWLLSVKMTHPTRRRKTAALAVSWLALLSWGVHDNLSLNFNHELPDAKKYHINAEANLRRFLATDDPRHLAKPDIPFPSAADLMERLSHPNLRALMPVPIRAPLPTEPASSRGFAENDARAADLDVARPPREGISPATPPLDGAKTWGSFGPAPDDANVPREWRSAPIPDAHRRLAEIRNGGPPPRGRRRARTP